MVVQIILRANGDAVVNSRYGTWFVANDDGVITAVEDSSTADGAVGFDTSPEAIGYAVQMIVTAHNKGAGTERNDL